MTEVIITAILSCSALAALVLIKPGIEIKGKRISIYWLAPLTGALVLLFSGLITPG